MDKRHIPTIAIVGRPNVGKSSLFNCIVGRRLSIVHEMSGVTRDRVVAPVVRGKKHFMLIDTGGLGMLEGQQKGIDAWDERIAEQVEAAVEDADVLIMVGNVQDGVLPLDESALAQLRQFNKPILFAANKSDNETFADGAVDFMKLGFRKVYPVSCLHRSGVEDVLRAALDEIAPELFFESADEEVKPVNIAVIGRPNVGKSSLVNALLGEERVMVSDVAGTTRDAIDEKFEIQCPDGVRPAVLVDTAGLRKQTKVDTVVEYFSAMRSKSAVERADLVLFLVEATEGGVTAQDKRIAAMISGAGKGCVLVANKYDLRRGELSMKKLDEEIRYALPGMAYAPLVFVSAKEKYNLSALLDRIVEVMGQLELSISTGLLNRVMADAFERKTPPVIGSAPLKLYYASLLGMRPPRVLLFVNNPKYCADNYLAYLRNSFREAFDLSGLPVEIKLRARPKKVMSFHTLKTPNVPTGVAKAAKQARAARSIAKKRRKNEDE